MTTLEYQCSRCHKWMPHAPTQEHRCPHCESWAREERARNVALMPNPNGKQPTVTPQYILDCLADIDRQLAEVEAVAQAVRLREAAEVLRYMTRKAQLSQEIQNAAALTRLHAERTIGELLETMPKNKGAAGNPHGQGVPYHDSNAQTYAEMGLTQATVTRYRTVAALPAAEFHDFVTDILVEQRDLTGAAVFRYAQNWLKKHRGEETVTTPHEIDCPRCGGSGRITIQVYEDEA